MSENGMRVRSSASTSQRRQRLRFWRNAIAPSMAELCGSLRSPLRKSRAGAIHSSPIADAGVSAALRRDRRGGTEGCWASCHLQSRLRSGSSDGFKTFDMTYSLFVRGSSRKHFPTRHRGKSRSTLRHGHETRPRRVIECPAFVCVDSFLDSKSAYGINELNDDLMRRLRWLEPLPHDTHDT